MQHNREQQALQLAALQREYQGLKNVSWHLKAEIEQYSGDAEASMLWCNGLDEQLWNRLNRKKEQRQWKVK